MKLDFQAIQTQFVDDPVRFKSVRMSRENKYLTGGVILSQSEWLEQPELCVSNPETTDIYPELLFGDSISDPTTLQNGELIILESDLKIAKPFRVKEISECGAKLDRGYCITVEQTDSTERYLYTSKTNTDEFCFKTKQDPSKSGFTAQVKRLPTLYSIVKIGGKKQLTEFELYRPKDESDSEITIEL